MKHILTSKRGAIFLIVLLMVSFVGCFQAAQYSYETTHLDVERPTSAPVASTVATNKEPVIVRVPAAASNETKESDFVAVGHLYAKSGAVVSVNVYEDVVRFVDTRGAEWEFYGAEDWQVGDRLCAIFDDAGTLDPYDDAVIRATYEAWDW